MWYNFLFVRYTLSLLGDDEMFREHQQKDYMEAKPHCALAGINRTGFEVCSMTLSCIPDCILTIF